MVTLSHSCPQSRIGLDDKADTGGGARRSHQCFEGGLHLVVNGGIEMNHFTCQKSLHVHEALGDDASVIAQLGINRVPRQSRTGWDGGPAQRETKSLAKIAYTAKMEMYHLR